jgi:hypothetical protein
MFAPEPLTVGETDVQFDPHYTQGAGAVVTLRFDDKNGALHYTAIGTLEQIEALIVRLKLCLCQAEALERRQKGKP